MTRISSQKVLSKTEIETGRVELLRLILDQVKGEILANALPIVWPDGDTCVRISLVVETIDPWTERTGDVSQ